MEEIVPDLRLQEIHIGGKIIFYRSDIAPVFLNFIAIDPFLVLIADQDILDEVVSVLHRTALDHLDQKPSADHIDPAGDRVGLRDDGLFLKFLDPAVLIHLDGAVAFQIGSGRHFFADNGDIRFLLNVIFQNLVVVHLVHTVPGCNDHIRLMAAL